LLLLLLLLVVVVAAVSFPDSLRGRALLLLLLQ